MWNLPWNINKKILLTGRYILVKHHQLQPNIIFISRDLKPYISTVFGKNIHFNCHLKLCNNFISFRESIYFSKQKMFFIEIFEITDNNFENLKILLKFWSRPDIFYENTLNVWNFVDAPHPYRPWTACHC